MKFSKLVAPVMLIASSLACAPAASGPRTAPDNQRRGKVEIRIRNDNWSTARVFVATRGGGRFRIATVNSGRIETKRVRIHSAYFALMVSFIAGNEVWLDFTEYSSEVQCLRINIMNTLYLTNTMPCLREET